MKRLLFILAFVLCCMPSAHAACSGSSPTWTAASTSAADVQACFNETFACGDTVIIPAGTSTWTTQVTLSPPTGCSTYQGVTVQGATICNGTPGVGVSSCVDNTNITLSYASGNTFSITGCSDTAFCTITGLTLITGVLQSNGVTAIQGTHGKVSFRIHHVHIKNAVSNAVNIYAYNGYGLIDHYLYDDTVASAGNSGAAVDFGGDLATAGEANWQDATNFGTNQAIIVEDSQANWATWTVEGFFDAYYGAKVVVRYTGVNGNEIGGGHGTDSGGQRSVVTYEIYNNTISCPSGPSNLMNTRGGTLLFFNNVVTGSCSTINLQYYRVLGQSSSSRWGTTGAGLNWTPISATPTNTLSDVVTLNAPDWQSNHSYTCSAGSPCLIGPLLHNTGTGVGGAGGYNYESTSNCTSNSSEPNPWNQTFPAGTQSDGTCTWTNIGGGTAASGAGAGFIVSTPDVPCASGGTCTRYFDANGGVYPFRDQPGTISNQVVYGNYEWNNSGAGLPSPVFGTDGATSSIIQSGRDYFLGSSPAGYTPYQYPDPLQGSSVVPAGQMLARSNL